MCACAPVCACVVYVCVCVKVHVCVHIRWASAHAHRYLHASARVHIESYRNEAFRHTLNEKCGSYSTLMKFAPSWTSWSCAAALVRSSLGVRVEPGTQKVGTLGKPASAGCMLFCRARTVPSVLCLAPWHEARGAARETVRIWPSPWPDCMAPNSMLESLRTTSIPFI